MTYRELLELYRNGKLPDEQRKKLEQEIERQEAIGDYLYERDDILELDGAFAPNEAQTGHPDDSDRFAQMIRKSIRRAFVRLGVIVGAVVLALVLAAQFVLPKAVSQLYYNPNEVVAADTDSEDGGTATTRMDLDMAVYSELYWPGRQRNTVSAVANGYGCYDIIIPQEVSYSMDGAFHDVGGRIERSKLTLFDQDFLKKPAGNAFRLPDELEQTRQSEYSWDWTEDEDQESMTASIGELDDQKQYIAYLSFDTLKSYDEVQALYQKWSDSARTMWCAVYMSQTDEEGEQWQLGNNMGFELNPCGSGLYWDTEQYPYLSLIGDWDDMSEQKVTTHFLSMLRYMKEQKQFLTMMDGDDQEDWDGMIASVEQNGLRMYGCAVLVEKQGLATICKEDCVTHLMAEPAE